MAACNFVKIGAILLAVASAASAITNIEMTPGENLVKPGENITIKYTVYGLGVGEIVRLEKIFDDKEPVVITTNHFFDGAFKGISRYNIDADWSQSDANIYPFTFTIAGAQDEDSGTYQVASAAYEGKPMVSINVLREPSDLEMYFGAPGAENKITDGEEFEFEADEERGIRCVVSGSNPPANVRIMRGDEDITDQFKSSMATQREETEVLGLEKIFNTVTMEAASVMIDYSFARKPLKCVAQVEGSENELSKSIGIKFQGFAPHFECDDSVMSFVGDIDFSITCKVTASPAVLPEDAYIYWHLLAAQNSPADPTEQVINEGTNGHYTAEFTKHGEEELIMVLRVERVFPQMARKHYFVAKNELGTVQHAVLIERDPSLEAVVDSASIAYGQFAATVQLSRNEADVGDTLKVTCEVTSDGQDTFFIVWVRKIGDEEFEIGTNNHINADFKKTNKYKADYKLGDNGDLSHVTFHLDITGVDSSDNGEIGCKIPKGDIEVFKPFTVNVPIASVKMTSTDVNGTHAVAYVDEQEVTFQEGEIRPWVCRVNGSYPKPKVVVSAGDIDITDKFVKKEELKKSGTIPGTQPLWYEVVLTAKNLSIEYEFNNRTLQCKATHHNGQEMSQGIEVHLSGYKPKFLCKKNLMTSIHTPDVNIVCTVRADPPVKDVKFTWTRFSEDNETLEQGQTKGHYKADLQPGNDEYETTMVLTIDKVFIQHFRKYYFMAENDLGKVTHEIELKQEDLKWLDSSTTIESIASQADSKKDPRSDGSFPQFSISLIALLVTTLLGL